MAKKIYDYQISYAEVILQALAERIDLELAAEDFNYLLDKSYSLDYLAYPLEENFQDLLLMLNGITGSGDKIFAVRLPRTSTEVGILDRQHQIDNVLSDLDVDAAAEISNQGEILGDNFIENPVGDFPLLFNGLKEFGDFLLSGDRDVLTLLFATVFFPPHFGWMLFFDYELEALHLMYMPDLLEGVKKSVYYTNNRYSPSEVSKMIKNLGPQ